MKADQKMKSTDGREIKAINIQMRFDGDDKGYKSAYALAEGLRKQFPYVRIIRSIDGMEVAIKTKNAKLLKRAIYVENYREQLRDYESVLVAWFEGKEIYNPKKNIDIRNSIKN